MVTEMIMTEIIKMCLINDIDYSEVILTTVTMRTTAMAIIMIMMMTGTLLLF